MQPVHSAILWRHSVMQCLKPLLLEMAPPASHWQFCLRGWNGRPSQVSPVKPASHWQIKPFVVWTHRPRPLHGIFMQSASSANGPEQHPTPNCNLSNSVAHYRHINIIYWFPSIFTQCMAEASDFRFGTQLGFAEAHHNIGSMQKYYIFGSVPSPRPRQLSIWV